MKLLSTFDKSGKVKICCIYKITNIINNKIYIGQTTNFRKRLSDYKNAHKKKYATQPIIQAIRHYGTDNFTIEILKLCDNDNLSIYENKYIDKYRSHLPEFGYNVVKNSDNKSNNSELSRKYKSIGHIGLKESKETKKKKSNLILAIKDGTLLICDSGKLFGDYIGVSKDMVKNGLRQPSRIGGYRLYYDDYNKRQEIREKMMKKRSIRDKGYMSVLDTLDKIEKEGVETSFYIFKSINKLVYTNDGFEIIEYNEEDYSIDTMNEYINCTD